MFQKLKKGFNLLKYIQKKEITIFDIAPILVAFLYCTSFFIVDFGFSITIYAGIIAIISVGIAILKFFLGTKKYELNVNISLILIFAITIITSFHNYDFKDNTKTYYLIIASLSFGVYITSEYNYKVSEIISNLIVFFGMLFSTLIYFFKFFPEVYKGIFFPFFSSDIISDINFVTAQGYSIFVYSSISYTLVMILFAIYILLYGKKGHPRWFMIMYMTVSVIISQRRTEQVMGLLTTIIILIISYHGTILKYIKKYRKIRICIVGIFLVGIVSIITLYSAIDRTFFSNNRILMTLYDIKYGGDVLNGRGIVYSIALDLLHNSWFTGIGWMNFTRYAPASGITMVRNVHNIYLQLILECGLILGLVYIGCIIKLVYDCIKNVKNNNMGMHGVAMLIYILLGGLLDNTIYYPYSWIIIGICFYVSGIPVNKVKLKGENR